MRYENGNSTNTEQNQALGMEEITVKLLEWTDPAPPDGITSFYDHCRAESPFGAYTIEWKSWKDYPGYVVEGPGEFFYTGQSLEDAKEATQAEFAKRIRSVISTRGE